MAVDPDVAEELRPIREKLHALQVGQDTLQERVERLEARPQGSALFAARDNLETAIFSAMQGMSDAEQVAFLNRVAEGIPNA